MTLFHILIRLATFEVIDGDFIKEKVFGLEENEEVDPFFEMIGFDSKKFPFIVGLPLYTYLVYMAIFIIILP